MSQQPGGPSRTSQGSYIVYRVGRGEFAVPLPDVREVIGLPAIKPVPQAHPVVVGVFELRQRVLPLCSLRRWLALGGEYDASAKVIVCQFGEASLGLQVDDVQRIHPAGPGTLQPPVGLEPYTDLIRATLRLEDRLVLLLDYGKLVAALRPGDGPVKKPA